MKDRVDFSLVRSLLKKEETERANSFRKGNFDAIGFVMRLALAGILLAAFIVFYGKFADVYLAVRTDGALNRPERLFELLSISYAVVLVLMVAGGVTQLIAALFASEDVKLLSAMPVGAKTLYIARLVTLYAKQITFSALTVLPVGITAGVHGGLSAGTIAAPLRCAFFCLSYPSASLPFWRCRSTHCGNS